MNSNGDILSERRRANLARVLKPQHIVFVGGARAEAAIISCLSANFEGGIYAVNPKRETMAGIPCLKSLRDLPVVPDAVFLGVSADATIEAVATLSKLGAGGVVCYASGFAESGVKGIKRNEALLDAACDMAIIGPNCFGLINYVNCGSLWPVAYPAASDTRGAAVVAQSGNVCINMSMNQRHVPFSYIISVGNQAMLDFGDYIDFLTNDEDVTSIGLFMEGIHDVAKFSAACIRAYERGVPVIVFRVGVSNLGAEMAATHTGSLAGQNKLYDALFDRLGVITAASVPQFMELLKMASLGDKLKGNRLAVFSSSGGDNGMAADFTEGVGLTLPPLSEKAVTALRPRFPDFAHIGNPLDFTAEYWGDEDTLYPIFMEALSEGYDQGLFVVDHPILELGEGEAVHVAAMVRAMGRACRDVCVPGVIASVYPESMPSVMRQQVIDEGLVPLQGLHDAGPVMGAWTKYCLQMEKTGKNDLLKPPLKVDPLQEGARSIVHEYDSKTRLSDYGLPVPRAICTTADNLSDAVVKLDGPVVLKVLHNDLPHKTEVGGVVPGIEGVAAVQAAAREIIHSVATHQPDLTLEHFLIEEMAEPPLAELLVGIKRDQMFGLVMVVAAGGVMVELMRDVERLLLPTTPVDINNALKRLKAFPLLDGFRGRSRADIPAVVKAISAIAAYAVDHQDSLEELDVNPLLVYPEGQGVLAVDALIVESRQKGIS